MGSFVSQGGHMLYESEPMVDPKNTYRPTFTHRSWYMITNWYQYVLKSSPRNSESKE